MDASLRRVMLELGAADHLEICLRGLARQQRRLKRARGDWSNESEFNGLVPDIWFALTLLSASQAALKLAKDASPANSSTIKDAIRELWDQAGVKKSRDVYTHQDDYFRGSGRLQRKEGSRRDMHLPQVGLTSGGTKKITAISVTIGSDSVDLFPAIQTASGS